MDFLSALWKRVCGLIYLRGGQHKELITINNSHGCFEFAANSGRWKRELIAGLLRSPVFASEWNERSNLTISQNEIASVKACPEPSRRNASQRRVNTRPRFSRLHPKVCEQALQSAACRWGALIPKIAIEKISKIFTGTIFHRRCPKKTLCCRARTWFPWDRWSPD